jgi:hypothetical protein
MAKALAEQIAHMTIVQRIVDNPAILSIFDNPQGTEQPKLVRNSRLGGPKETGNVADAEFFKGKCMENPDPSGVTKDPEGFGQPEKHSFRGHGIPDGSDFCLVNKADSADGVFGHQ